MGIRMTAALSLVFVALSGAAFAQGDAGFCGRYAANMAGVGDLAVKKNPACLDYSKGVHGNYQSHFDWCMRTPAASVQGAETHIRRLVTQCTGNATAPAPAGGGKPNPKNATVPAGTMGPFKLTRTYDAKGSLSLCSAAIVSNGREVRIYQHAGDGFGLHFKGPAGKKGLYVQIGIPGGGIISHDAIPINGSWFKAQLDTIVINALRQSPPYMDVTFEGVTTKYTLRGQSMPDVLKAIGDCRRAG